MEQAKNISAPVLTDEMRTDADDLLTFLAKSPTCFHAADEICARLNTAGFVRLFENEPWNLTAGCGYYVVRNRSAVVAFVLPDGVPRSLMITACHSDSPTFQIKEHAELETCGHYLRLNTERYGGMIPLSWMDRPLSVAGRLLVRRADGEGAEARLVTVDRDLLVIPSVAIHMQRDSAAAPNAQVDLLPLFGDIAEKGALTKIVSESAGVSAEDILSSDLYLYNRTHGTVWGANREYLSAGRLDDLQCVWAGLRGFLEAKRTASMPVFSVLDNEEVGSGTKQGAASGFLDDVLCRAVGAIGLDRESYLCLLANSFMLSADNAHAVHPNHPEYADPSNQPYLNRGVVLKRNANMRYTTDALSASLFALLCREAEVPMQTFRNRSDLAGGSTLGCISGTRVPVITADIGLPQLSMHSSYETAGVADGTYMIHVMRAFYPMMMETAKDGGYRILA